MIVGIGTDVCSIERIRKSLDRFGERLVNRILTPAERPRFARTKDKAGHLAKRFAAKEAFSKAIGTGIHAPFTWHSITVTRNPKGRPGIEPNVSSTSLLYPSASESLARSARDRAAAFFSRKGTA